MVKIIALYLKRIIKKPHLIIVWIIFPFVIIMLYYLAFGPKGKDKEFPKVGLLILDEDKSFASQFFYQAFKRKPLNKYFSTEYVENEKKIIKLFQRNVASVAIIIPKDFQSNLLKGEKVYLNIIKNPNHHFGPLVAEESFQMILELSNYFISNIKEPLRKISKFKDEKKDPTIDDIDEISRSFYASGKKMSNLKNIFNIQCNLIIENKKKAKILESSFFFSSFLPGIIFFSLMFLGLEIQHIIFRDNIYGITRRLLIAPVSKNNILIAHFLYLYIALLIYSSLVFSISKIILNIEFLNFFNFITVLLGFILFVSAFCQLIFAIPKSDRAASSLASVIIVVINMIGGAFVPLNFFPDNIKNVVKYNPVGMTNIAAIDTLTKGNSFNFLIPYIIGIWLWSIIILFFAFLLQKKRLFH